MHERRNLANGRFFHRCELVKEVTKLAGLPVLNGVKSGAIRHVGRRVAVDRHRTHAVVPGVLESQTKS